MRRCQGQLASSPKPGILPQVDFGMQETERKPHPCGWPRARHGEPTDTPWLNLSATQAHGRAVLEGKHLKTTLQPPEHPPGPSAAGEGAASPRKEVGGEAAGRGCPGPASARPSNQAGCSPLEEKFFLKRDNFKLFFPSLRAMHISQAWRKKRDA